MVLVLTIFTIASLQAQDFKLGVTATPTISFVASDNNDVESDGNSIGLVYGLMADYNISQNERYSLFTGFNIHHTSAKFISRSDAYKVAATFIQVPAVFKLHTNPVNLKSFYAQFGFNLGLPISNKVKEGPEEQVNVAGLLLAINMGAGMHYELTKNGVTLNLGIYFNNGFTNVYEIEGEDFRLKHLGFRLGAYF